MTRGGTVYILTNNHNTVLYVGVTADLVSRVMQHRDKIHPHSFTTKYNICKLIYYESFSTIEEAIAREKQVKKYSRVKKAALIEKLNPGWNDLFEEEVKHW